MQKEDEYYNIKPHSLNEWLQKPGNPDATDEAALAVPDDDEYSGVDAEPTEAEVAAKAEAETALAAAAAVLEPVAPVTAPALVTAPVTAPAVARAAVVPAPAPAIIAERAEAEARAAAAHRSTVGGLAKGGLVKRRYYSGAGYH